MIRYLKWSKKMIYKTEKVKTADGEYVYLKTGDNVKIKNKNRTFSTYYDMAKIMKLQNFIHGFLPDNGMEGKIVKMCMNEYWHNVLCIGVRLNNKVDIIIGPRGLVKTTRLNILIFNDDLFEL